MGRRSTSKTTNEIVPARRRWLTQVTALASTTALPLSLANAWGKSASTMQSTARIALIIGNSDYAQAPLKSPASDAQALGDALRNMGFEVSVALNANRMQLLDAIREFTGELTRNHGVGFFYYAGHSAQHASRNYLIPVDATVRKLDELPAHAVELNSLLQGLSAAGNAMNVIVLDASRDKPFGDNVRIAQKGLAQFDAPPGALIAYSTAPGKTIADNRIYATSLLREMAGTESSIEDVFKRVRLSVRRETKGRQVPWQSAALDQDMYVGSVAQNKKLSRRERERQFDSDRQSWEKVRLSKDPAELEDYLRCHPSGKFCELGQARLDRLLATRHEGLAPAAVAALALTSIAPNPFSRGTIRADASFTPGDSYTYRRIDAISKAPHGQFTETVTGVANNSVTLNSGAKVIDFSGNELKSATAGSSTAQFFPAEYAIGRKWTTRFDWANEGPIEVSLRIVGKETISVPAGTFDVFKIEGEGEQLGLGGGRWKHVSWVAPEISRRPVAMETIIENHGRRLVAERCELTGFRQSISPAPDAARLTAQMNQRLALNKRVLAA